MPVKWEVCIVQCIDNKNSQYQKYFSPKRWQIGNAKDLAKFLFGYEMSKDEDKYDQTRSGKLIMQLLDDGWEPFSADGFTLYLRRQIEA